MSVKSVGTAIDRVDGRAKVTGAAKYANDFVAKDAAYAVLVSSTIAKGRIKKIDADAALRRRASSPSSRTRTFPKSSRN